MSISTIKVRYAETDAMGVVHHANYYLYFEVAREDLIEGMGISYKEIEDMGIMMPLVETQCRYKDAAKYGDTLLVEAKVSELTPLKVSIMYTVRRDCDGKVLVVGNTTQTFVNKETFKLINIKRVSEYIWDKLSKDLFKEK